MKKKEEDCGSSYAAAIKLEVTLFGSKIFLDCIGTFIDGGNIGKFRFGDTNAEFLLHGSQNLQKGH